MPAKPFRYPVGSVVVGGKKIGIAHDPKNSEDWGEYHHDAGMILLSDAVATREDFHKTVCHELLHATLGLSGLTHMLSNEMEESLVRAMENIFLPALDDFNARMKRK